ncbi:aminotransferase class V-fold PLP-dependent enzyme [Treponema parvum]|uniref:aminotransferase class V-fold PLP-dependent enzyme n=1 Tax=Treponema parvum TaxID=138851 RepID=UPI001AEC36E8|nr:SufS family cysteine desulfurase [Treponema parvum]QTQ16149.1 SufS family cysteine desulfurase [Treponema parvum]
MNNIYRKDFPFFSNKQNEGLIYFDNAATAQRPVQVIEALKNFYEINNANPLRGLYALSVRATEAYENARHTIAEFINAKGDEEIIFTRNATESLNLVAYSYGMANVNAGDEIVVSVMEHHSNILPWQMVCKAKGAKLVYIECNKENGIIDPDEIESKICRKTKIVAITQVSNVLGITNPVKHIARIAHKNGAIIVVDGAQSVPHIKVDVRDLDADFFAFSGHKITGPMGTGVLYGKKELLENMTPFLRGGEMIEYVTRQEATFAEIPQKFEAGTVNAAGAVGLAAAIDYVRNIGIEKIAEHDNYLSTIMLEGIKNIPHVRIIGHPDADKHCGIITFTVEGVHPHDIATVLDTEKIAVRAGHHCAQPLGKYLGIPSSARASLYFYNTEDEVAVFIEKLKNVRKWMGYGN